MEKLKETLNDLKLTDDEISKLSEAFKKEEFKKLFREYAEELQDPENKRKYEEELTAMENERGMDVEFINPIPGHALKTIQNPEKKVFINICQSDKIEKPSVNKTVKNEMHGATWSIPHSFAPPREDMDKKKESCLVYDVVFNTNAYQMGSKNPRFRKMLHDTALEGIEQMFKVELDKINFKILKLKMKGVPVATVIRKKRSDFEEKQANIENQVDDPLKFPYPDGKETEKTEYFVDEKNRSTEFTKPVYKIKYSDSFEMANFVGQSVSVSSRPKKMIVEIKLPLISSANCVDLDIEKNRLKLTTEKPVKYLLELKLTYPVLPDLGSAKFDKATRTLKLDLPIEQIPVHVNALSNDLSNDKKDLIEELELDNVEIDDKSDDCQSEKNSDDSDQELRNNDSGCNVVKSENVIEIERIIPKVEMKFRKSNTHVFLLCEIRNVDKTDWSAEYELLSSTKHQMTINFTNCGQGGWKNFYKIPLVVNFSNDVQSIDNCIQCFISDENIVMRLPLQINDHNVDEVSFLDQTFSCKCEEITYKWDTLIMTAAQEEDEEETFNTAHGAVNKNTFKIICAPLDTEIDSLNEFPVNAEDDLDLKDQTESGKDLETEMEVEILRADTYNCSVEPLKEVSVLESTQAKSSIIPSEFFEERRKKEHRTVCAVELSSNLLFDLE